MRSLALAAALTALLAAPALAEEECTQELSDKRTEALFDLLAKNPDKAPFFDQYVEEVEAEYGGKPTEEQSCEALLKLIKRVKGEE